MSIIASDKIQRRGIKNLTAGLVERGKIKIGNKGAMRSSAGGNKWQAPQKLDHFLITTTARGDDNNFLRDEQLHGLLGDKPTEIPVVLVYDDIDLNFQTRYASYNGRRLWCSGDGEVARRMVSDDKKTGAATYQEGSCPCIRQSPTYTEKDKCKINGTLSVMIRGAEAIGGVWKFRTTSYNSVVGIMSSLALIKRITGGPLAGIPLVLTLTPKSVADPITQNQQKIFVVGIEFRGGMELLQNQGHELLLNRTAHGLRIDHIEDEARQLISYSPENFAAPIDDVDSELEEFYPDVASDLESHTGGVVSDVTGPADLGEKKESSPAVLAASGAGAMALNAAASSVEIKKPVAPPEAEKQANNADESPRIAGRMTYWVNRETGEFSEIAKGEAIPLAGETVSKTNYQDFVGDIAPTLSEEPAASDSSDDSGVELF